MARKRTVNQELVVSQRSQDGKILRPERRKYHLSDETKKKILLGVKLGMPVERLIPLAGIQGDGGAWRTLLAREPEFSKDLAEARSEGEIELLNRVHSSEVGWQGAAWLLERARGYVARASLEHTGKGGSQLTIAHQVLTAVGEKEK